MNTYHITLPDGSAREFARMDVVSVDLLALIEQEGDTLRRREDEPKEAYAKRLFRWFFADRSRLNDFMHMALFGDHTGIDWSRHVSGLLVAQIFTAFLTAVLPLAIEQLSQLGAAEGAGELEA